MTDFQHILFYPFLPEASIGYCRCLRLSVRPSVRPSVRHQVCPRDNSSPDQARITRFNTQVSKTLVKIFIVFGGDWPWPSRSNLTSKSKFTSFWACPRDNPSPVHARATKFEPEVLNTLVKIPVVLGVDWAWLVNFNLFSKSCLFASLLRLWNICETCKKTDETESVPHPKWLRTYMLAHRNVSWTVEQSVVSLMWPLLASQSSTRRLAMDF